MIYSEAQTYLYIKTLLWEQDLSVDLPVFNDNSVATITIRDSELLPLLHINDFFESIDVAITFITNLKYGTSVISTDLFVIPTNIATSKRLSSLFKGN